MRTIEDDDADDAWNAAVDELEVVCSRCWSCCWSRCWSCCWPGCSPPRSIMLLVVRSPWTMPAACMRPTVWPMRCIRS